MDNIMHLNQKILKTLSKNTQSNQEYFDKNHNIQLQIDCNFCENYSNFSQNIFFWIYNIKITNYDKKPIKLLNRFWRIMSNDGHIEEYSGEGVIGQQPIIKPHETFEYSSGVNLNCPSGIMGGHYQIKKEEQNFFLNIPNFSLDSPFSSNLSLH